MPVYPDCFPDNFASEILPKEAKYENKPVYRIIKFGKINRDAFISSYEEVVKGLRPAPKIGMDLDDPGTYSTSCNMEYSEAEYMLKIFMRHYPRPCIAKGLTEYKCGPCQLTSEREERIDTHVDWWIYKDANPQDYFEEVNSIEG